MPVSVTVRSADGTELVRLEERFAIRGRTGEAELTDPVRAGGAISDNATDTPRRRRRDVTVSIDEPEIGGGRLGLVATLKSTTAKDPEQDTLANERERALKKALGTLKLVYREAVILRDIEGFAYEEIATALDISVGTVKSRLARGRQELRRKLEGSL